MPPYLNPLPAALQLAGNLSCVAFLSRGHWGGMPKTFSPLSMWTWGLLLKFHSSLLCYCPWNRCITGLTDFCLQLWEAALCTGSCNRKNTQKIGSLVFDGNIPKTAFVTFWCLILLFNSVVSMVTPLSHSTCATWCKDISSITQILTGRANFWAFF